ncbi:hypothetical protein Celaphus_00006484 [Cervus elaphus hippelaphus]|uniref:Uncharacterized protein n=1 Tax=Cervus elaphus hippelaphus TaxID=46360 RepID=A0A212CU29_CEREH|nr:hypothetical protein Celaphus_00006484 [Cervus elaphus hippelaphus]
MAVTLDKDAYYRRVKRLNSRVQGRAHLVAPGSFTAGDPKRRPVAGNPPRNHLTLRPPPSSPRACPRHA